MIATKGYGWSVYDIEWSTPKELAPYLEAYKQEQRNADTDRFYQGLYMVQAIASCFSEKAKYPEKPFFETYDPTLTEEERNKKKLEEFVRTMEALEKRFNSNKQEETNGGTDE